MHDAILETRNEHWPDEATCARQAQAWAAALRGCRDAVIELHGPLGAGKTTFVRHLLRALGVMGRVKSPSYAVLESYEVDAQMLWHFDFYRFSDPNEWEDAGFRDIFAGTGLKLIEWPDRASEHLPPPDLRFHLSWDEDSGRTVRIEALSPHGQNIVRQRA